MPCCQHLRRVRPAGVLDSDRPEFACVTVRRVAHPQNAGCLVLDLMFRTGGGGNAGAHSARWERGESLGGLHRPAR